MYKLILSLIFIFFIAACETDVQDDLRGNATISGQLTLRDKYRNNSEVRIMANKKVFISYPRVDSVNYIYYTVTDAQGNFKFERLKDGGEYLLFFTDSIDNVLYSSYVTITAPKDSVKMLAENDSIRQNGMMFYVLNAQGEPIKDVEVGLFNNKEVFDADTSNKLSIAKRSTDQYGRVIFYSYKKATYYVRAVTSNQSGRISGELTYDFSGAGIGSDTLFLQTTPAIKNTLLIKTLDESGNVLPKVKVCTFNNPLVFDTETCDGSMRSDSTGADGTVKINNLLAGSYYLYAKFTLGGVDYMGQITLPVAATGTTPADVVLKKIVPNELLVRTVDEAGNILPGITTCLFNNALLFNQETCDGKYRSDASKTDGKISFTSLPPGNYYLYAEFVQNNIKYMAKANATVNATGQTSVDLVLRKVVSAYELEITTMDVENTPVNDTKLYFFTSRSLWVADTTLGASHEKATGKNGKITITDMEQGKYYIRARVVLGGHVVMKGADSVTIVNSPVKISKTVIVR